MISKKSFNSIKFSDFIVFKSGKIRRVEKCSGFKNDIIIYLKRLIPNKYKSIYVAYLYGDLNRKLIGVWRIKPKN